MGYLKPNILAVVIVTEGIRHTLLSKGFNFFFDAFVNIDIDTLFAYEADE